MTTTSDTTVSEGAFKAMLKAAYRAGKRYGESSADFQYLPGGGRDTMRNAAGRAAELLRAIDDGDPGACDGIVPTSPLSGEWADGLAPRDVADAVGFPYDDEPEADRDEAVEELAREWDCGFTDGAFDAACKFLRNVAKGDA